ncbi:hypothetical protein AVEN_6014-1 [Araneus ventricosus]|uniref:Uncharacterized protein n=1 Tax=Araneus ventricosus TaxID=182803 RepID=A0A4Y2K4L3_ARAVE|nr:hypothetical protein AVEN_6014-1 [Araneus ventricosus]
MRRRTLGCRAAFTQNRHARNLGLYTSSFDRPLHWLFPSKVPASEILVLTLILTPDFPPTLPQAYARKKVTSAPPPLSVLHSDSRAAPT